MSCGFKLIPPLFPFPLQGNVTGQNEYIVYNMYRVLPAYIMEYTCPPQTQ